MTEDEEDRRQREFNRKADRAAAGCLEWGCGWPLLLALPLAPLFLLVR